MRSNPTLVALALLAALSLGCTKPSAQVTAIEVYGIRNLPHTTVRVVDPQEIASIVALTRALPAERVRVYVSMDVAAARVARLRLVYADRHDDYTLAEGLMQVPGDSGGTFYNPDNHAQAQLWAFVLARLESSVVKQAMPDSSRVE